MIVSRVEPTFVMPSGYTRLFLSDDGSDIFYQSGEWVIAFDSHREAIMLLDALLEFRERGFFRPEHDAAAGEGGPG